MPTRKNNITAIIFDLGRVIVDIDISRLTSIVLDDTSKPIAPKTLLQIMSDELMLRFNRGDISPHDFHRALCEKYNLETSFDQFDNLWCSIFSPMPGMDDLIRSLHKKTTLGLLSDTDPLHWRHLHNNYPILKLFKTPTLSFEVGLTKPDPKIFRTAAKNINTPPKNCLFIDDLQPNVTAATATGLNAIQFKSTKNLITQLTKYGLY